MDSKLQTLPPLKRFKLQHQDQTQNLQNQPPLLPLPAKKRKDYSPPSPNQTTTSCHLPAKKRVWAPQPIFNSPEKPVFDSTEKPVFDTPEKNILAFDLNVEYQISPEKQPPGLPKMEEKELKESSHSQKVEEEEEDDGVLCGVCNSTDGDQTDPIVFCDGCDLMVHASCYGAPLIESIPEGDWFCATCEAKEKKGEKEGVYDCCLCPVKGGVMKATTDGRWAHVLCALFVPEVFFRDPEGRNQIDCSQVPERRWERICYVCGSSKGCGIECSDGKCLLAFHVGCGLNEELCIEYRQGRRSEKGGGIVVGFCKTHTQLWKKEQKTGKFKIVARECKN